MNKGVFNLILWFLVEVFVTFFFCNRLHHLSLTPSLPPPPSPLPERQGRSRRESGGRMVGELPYNPLVTTLQTRKKKKKKT